MHVIINCHLQVLGAVDNESNYKDVKLYNINDEFIPIFVDKEKFFFCGGEYFFFSL